MCEYDLSVLFSIEKTQNAGRRDLTIIHGGTYETVTKTGQSQSSYDCNNISFAL